MKTFEDFLNEGALKTGDWIFQTTGRSDPADTYALVLDKNKGGGYKVVKFTIMSGSMAGKATMASTKGWHPEPKAIDMKKVPPKVQDKIMSKAEKYL